MKVAALGRTRWLYGAIEELRARGHEIVAIATAAAAPEYDVREDAFEALARELDCAFSADLAAGIDTIRRSGADVAISVNWLTLVPQELLDAIPHGVLNGHPGDLPRYRGNAAPNWAILAGESEVVATVHRMDAGLDSGPVLLRRAFPIDDSTYIGEIYAFLDAAFPALFAEAIDGLERGTLTAVVQSDNSADSLRGLPRLPRDSELDWTQPAELLARLVRASAEPFAGAYTWVGTRRLTVWRAHPERAGAPRDGRRAAPERRRPRVDRRRAARPRGGRARGRARARG